MEKRHIQLPNDMGCKDLTPKDQLIYLAIKSFKNEISKEAFISLVKLKDILGTSVDTIRKGIQHLKEKGYIEVIKVGKTQKYKFNPYKEFEPFSYDFLNRKDLTFTEKAYLAASQQYMFKDVEDYGKISYSNKELSNLINMPESTISKTNRSLQRKNYLTVLKNDSRDLETGCHTDTKVFNLKALGQAIIWTLKDHEYRITETEEKYKELQEKIESQQKMIDSLMNGIKEFIV